MATIQLILFLIHTVALACGKEVMLDVFGDECSKNGIFCKTNTSFFFCTKMQDYSILIVKEYFCPEGYFCNKETPYPCISTEEITTETTAEMTTETIIEITTETTKGTTSQTTTTTKKPVSPPSCIGTGLYEGPTCRQYYECVYASFLTYKPVLRTCGDELYFSVKSKSCVSPELSGCIE